MGKIIKVAGPLVVAELPGGKNGDMVEVGELKLIGEIIELKGNQASIQVYEETSGLKVGDEITSTNTPLSVELGPGLLSAIYDGIQRPLDLIMKESGNFIKRGVKVSKLDRKKKWHFVPVAKAGENVIQGDILGTVQETSLVSHKIMAPKGIQGTVDKIEEGDFTIDHPIAIVSGNKVTMVQKRPIRQRNLLDKKEAVTSQLITGQRIIDTLFPIARGGTAAVPGPFGAGKTVIQHQLAKWSNADIIIFVGCGERGNEMTDVLLEFPKLKDPKTGKPLMERTVLIANTSNMPIAAREASVNTGATIAEYFRDMGYHVALMADSTSRWAEALREMSGRLEEMPGEEGYPAYLASRLAAFYERAGYGECHGKDQRKGSLTIIGSVSPPGGDLSEPVVQNTLRVVKVFWGLDYKLAHARHFPAINWIMSYSLYVENLSPFLINEVADDFVKLREETLALLSKEDALDEIVRLVGLEALSEQEQLVLLVSKSVREDFLYQSAFDPIDQYSTLKKQYYILKLIISIFHNGKKILAQGLPLEEIKKITFYEELGKVRFVPENEMEEYYKTAKSKIDEEVKSLLGAVSQNV
ncbi:MAG: V-type ATP synthase subunit A [Candidatus Saganbacteria bacterium]|nr:V-type ATP synthase subunit A [Candidatus Saganbacteria bacterium]